MIFEYHVNDQAVDGRAPPPPSHKYYTSTILIYLPPYVPISNRRPSMIATEPTLGIHASAEVELFVILSPCGPYFSTGVKPVNLMADSRYVRAWPGKYIVHVCH